MGFEGEGLHLISGSDEMGACTLQIYVGEVMFGGSWMVRCSHFIWNALDLLSATRFNTLESHISASTPGSTGLIHNREQCGV